MGNLNGLTMLRDSTDDEFLTRMLSIRTAFCHAAAFRMGVILIMAAMILVRTAVPAPTKVLAQRMKDRSVLTFIIQGEQTQASRYAVQVTDLFNNALQRLEEQVEPMVMALLITVHCNRTIPSKLFDKATQDWATVKIQHRIQIKINSRALLYIGEHCLSNRLSLNRQKAEGFDLPTNGVKQQIYLIIILTDFLLQKFLDPPSLSTLQPRQHLLLSCVRRGLLIITLTG